MRAVVGWVAVLGLIGCGGAEPVSTDGGESTPHEATPAPEPPPPPLSERADWNPTLGEVARLEDSKERANGRLAELLASDPDPRVRRAAAMALGHIHDPADADALLTAFGDSEESVVVAALFATGLLHEGKTRPPAGPLLPMLAHPSATVRAAAVEAVGRIGTADEADAVHALFRDSDPRVRGEAALASWRIATHAAPIAELTDESSKEEHAAHEAAVDARDAIHAGVPLLVEVARTEPEPEARWRMVYALQELRRSPPRGGPTPPEIDAAATAALKALAESAVADADRRVREMGLLLAGRVLKEEAGAVIAPGLADPEWTVRVRALNAVQISKATGVLATVRSLAATDPHHLARRTALGVLAAAEDEGALPMVTDSLRAKSPSVRRAALAALAALEGPAALGDIEPFLADADPWMRVAALEAIAAILKKEPTDDQVRRVMSLLTPRLAAGTLLERATVLDSAEHLPIGPACDLIERGLQVDELEVRGSACAMLGKRAKDIQELGRDMWPSLQAAWDGSQGPGEYELRQLVCEAVGQLGGDPAEPLLRTALGDPHAAVRKAAAEALSELTDTEVAAPEGPPAPAPGRPDPVDARRLDLPRRLRIETNKGTMVLELFPDDAPLHVYSLVTLARAKRYDGLVWHRVVDAFVIQGGCPRGTGWGDPGYTLNNEVNPQRYAHGVLGMPDAGLDTGGCQLFINHTVTPHLDGRYTVFGRVIEGLDVVDRIEVGDKILRVRDE